MPTRPRTLAGLCCFGLGLGLGLPPARAADPYGTTVTGEQAPTKELTAQTLRNEEITKIPGTLGDPLRAIENLPGMARAPFNTGLFIIEGARPSDSRVYLGSAEVPQLYHYGGFTSVVPGSFLARIDYLPHNFSVRYGRATAGTIDVELRGPRRDRYHGALDVNPVHAAVEAEGPLGKGGFLLGVRRSYIDAGLALASRVAGDPPGLRFVSAPVYWDYQALFEYPLGGGRLRIWALGADDQLKLLFDRPQDADPTINGLFSTHIQFHRLQARYRRHAGPFVLSLQQTLGFNSSELSLGRGVSLAVRTISADLRLEAWRDLGPGKKARLLIGWDSQSAYVWLDALVPAPLREGEFQRGPGTLNQVRAAEQGFFTNIGLYAEVQGRPHERVSLTAGLRGDFFSYLRRWNLDPRLGLRLRATPLTFLVAGAGLYTQDPAVQDYFGAAFGNPGLRLERAAHLTLAVEQAIYRGLTLTLTGIYKHLWDFASPSGASLQDGGAGRPERVASQARGRIYGGTAMLRQAMSKHLFGWISYSLLRSERRDCAACAWRLFDFDQTHVLILAVHAYLPYRFEVGLRFRYISGFPYTLARTGFYDSDTDLYQPRVGAVNTERLDAMNQLDLRIDRTFTWKRLSVKIYLDVSNVYNRPAPEQVLYSYDHTQRAPLGGLPIIPSLGIRGEL